MKLFVVLTVLSLSISASSLDEWVSFKQSHGKKYKNPIEEQYRMKVFLKNKVLIDEHNKNYENGLVTYHTKMNHFGDLTAEEFRIVMNKFNSSKVLKKRVGSTFFAPQNAEVPASIDWRQKGAVTPVKDQGRTCASCWAFSTTGSLEGQIFRKTGKLVSLSEQNLIDCSTENFGCEGGLAEIAFPFIKSNGGIDTEESYPYEGTVGACRFKKSAIGGTVTGFVNIPTEDEEALKVAVATVGPVSVDIDASKPLFPFYSGGVYYEGKCSSEDRDHAVLVVGYGSENGQDYWTVKNSWNAVWGDQGYIKMARNKNNHCGIASSAVYPLV